MIKYLVITFILVLSVQIGYHFKTISDYNHQTIKILNCTTEITEKFYPNVGVYNNIWNWCEKYDN